MQNILSIFTSELQAGKTSFPADPSKTAAFKEFEGILGHRLILDVSAQVASEIRSEISNLHDVKAHDPLRHTALNNSKRMTVDEYKSNELSRRGVAPSRRLSSFPRCCAHVSSRADFKIDKIRR